MNDMEQAVLLVESAAGSLPASTQLLVHAHLAMRPGAAAALEAAEIVGGALLEGVAPAPMVSAPILHAAATAPGACPERSRFARAQSLIEAARTDPESLAWRWTWFGVRSHTLPVPGARLLRVRAGAAVPRHGHPDTEVTLVLCGAFEDDQGVFSAGEVAIAGPDRVHRPRNPGREDCICLIATTPAARA
jgi:putative transcriptional regulator